VNFRKTKRFGGKLYARLEKIDHGPPCVAGAYAKSAVARRYEKFSAFCEDLT
jgi:hypothetical protein